MVPLTEEAGATLIEVLPQSLICPRIHYYLLKKQGIRVIVPFWVHDPA